MTSAAVRLQEFIENCIESNVKVLRKHPLVDSWIGKLSEFDQSRFDSKDEGDIAELTEQCFGEHQVNSTRYPFKRETLDKLKRTHSPYFEIYTKLYALQQIRIEAWSEEWHHVRRELPHPMPQLERVIEKVKKALVVVETHEGRIAGRLRGYGPTDSSRQIDLGKVGALKSIKLELEKIREQLLARHEHLKFGLEKTTSLGQICRLIPQNLDYKFDSRFKNDNYEHLNRHSYLRGQIWNWICKIFFSEFRTQVANEVDEALTDVKNEISVGTRLWG